MLATYIKVNYTELEDLPMAWDEVHKVNLTLPITSTKELKIAVQALREYYFFHKISEEWISFKEKDDKSKEESKLNDFPSDLEKLNKELKQNEPDVQWSFLIKTQEDVPEALDYLREKYPWVAAPEWVFEIEELPEPKWDIFNKQEITAGWDDMEIDNTNNHDEQ